MSEVEYWWDKKIEKYMFKFWNEEEQSYQGITNKTLEGGLKSMQARWTQYDFVLKERKAA